jgi:glycerol uptake facilitator-like aquaporin
MPSLKQQCTAEALGSALLVATVVGSGIMAQRLSAGNDAVALLGNTGATVCMLFVLITALGPISGAHFNPAVSLAMTLRRALPWQHLAPFILCQCAGAVAGTLIAHAMFELPLLQASTHARAGLAQGFSEVIATAGLLFTIFGVSHSASTRTPLAVALYIGAAYWFTASTSFANPAVTIARMFTDSFSGIAPADAPLFIAAQLLAALIATPLLGLLFKRA